MTDLPLISVIVPVYRVEAYLDRCVQSIVSQTYPNLEIILIDDGSPDRSGAMCDAWAARDSRIRVIHQENAGGGQARNAGLDAATGERIAFVDSDDYLAPDGFRYLETLLEQGADIAEGAYVETTEDNTVFGADAGEVRFYTPLEAMGCHIRDTAFRQLIWNKLYRRKTVGDVRFPVGTKIDDEFFTYRVLGNARRLVRSDKQVYAYRQQPDSVMHGGFSLRRLEGIQAQEQRLEYLKTNMPSLVYEGRANLFLHCQYAMQMSLRYLSGTDLQTARESLKKTVSRLTPLMPSRKLSAAGNLWLLLGQLSFEGSCRLQNFLERKDTKRGGSDGISP
ncbi:MAG: glycosyltransferase [Firmicutes bacterium]|nr:glycosyltransferase [Bacillota bacterium]